MPSGPEGNPTTLRSVFTDIVRASTWYAVVPIGQRLASVLLLPLYTRFLTPADYGVIELLTQASIIVAILLGANFSSGLGYHYFQQTSSDWRKKVGSTCIVGTALIGATAALLGWELAAPLAAGLFHAPSFVVYLRILFATMSVDFLLEGLLVWLRVENRPAAVVVASLARLVLTICCTVLLLAVFRMGIVGVLWSNLVATASTAVPLAVYALRILGFHLDAHLFSRMLRFSIPLALSSLALFIIHSGDRFFLQHYRTLADIGLYGLAYRIGMLISLAHGTFHAYWSTQLYAIMKRKDGSAVFTRVFTYMMLVLGWCALGLVVLARPMLGILTTPAFQGAARVVPLIVAAYFIRAIGDFFRCLFYVEGRPEWDAVCNWLGAAVCIGGYLALIPPFGIWGAAGATVITFLVIGVVAVGWTYRLRPFRLDGVRLCKLGVVTSALVWLSFVPRWPLGLAAELGWAALLLLSFPLLLLALRFPTEVEYSRARSALLRGLSAVGLMNRSQV